LIGLSGKFGAVAIACAVALRSLTMFPFRMKTTLAPEAIAPIRFALALIAPILLAAGMSAPVGLWRVAALGRLSDVVFVGVAVAIGVAAVGALLFGLMPKVVARLRSFLSAEQ
jgi:hypothetical protein